MTKIFGDLEQEIMDIVWDSQNPVKPSDVQKKLRKELSYNTVMTVMSRLEKKGVLKRQKCANFYCYQSAKPREKYVKNNVGELFQNLLGSYGELAISQFVDTVKNDPKNLELLEEYLNDTKNK